MSLFVRPFVPRAIRVPASLSSALVVAMRAALARARAHVDRASSHAFASSSASRGRSKAPPLRVNASNADVTPPTNAKDASSDALLRALASVNAVASGNREAFDAVDARAIASALDALVGDFAGERGRDGGGRAERDGDETVPRARAREGDSEARVRVKRACALIREVERACLEVGCKTCVSPDALERVCRLGCSLKNDIDVTLAVTRAFYSIAKKGKGATSVAHATLRTYTDVIAALSRCAAEARASGSARTTPSPVEVWLMLRATPLKLDGVAFAAGVSAYVSEGRVEEAERVLRDMTAEGVRAGPRLFNTLIAGYGREKNLRGVEASSMTMRTLGVTPNQATWGAKVFAYVSCDRLDLAMNALDQGVRFSPRVERRPGVQAYTSLVQGLSRSGRLIEADEVLRRMSRDGVKPNVYTYSTLIDGFVRASQIGLAETALEEMRRAKIKPNVVTYNSLLKGVLSGAGGPAVRTDEMLSRAKDVFERMRADGIPPDLVSYNTLIDACINAGAPAEAWNILREISESGLRPNIVTYTTLLKYFVEVGDHSATSWVVAELEKDLTVVEDVGVYNCLINAYARQGDMARAMETMETMRAKKIAPDISTYGALTNGYVRVGNVREALNLYESCSKTDGLTPDARMRKSLVYGCGLQGMSDVADCIIADLQATGAAGAREAKSLRFVLKASSEAKAAGADGRVRAKRPPVQTRRVAAATRRARAINAESPTVSPETFASARASRAAREAPLEWNRGLEMWKFWLGLPNNYYYGDVAIDDDRRPSAPPDETAATDAC